jgi:hypothetical protein
MFIDRPSIEDSNLIFHHLKRTSLGKNTFRLDLTLGPERGELGADFCHLPA